MRLITTIILDFRTFTITTRRQYPIAYVPVTSRIQTTMSLSSARCQHHHHVPSNPSISARSLLWLIHVAAPCTVHPRRDSLWSRHVTRKWYHVFIHPRLTLLSAPSASRRNRPKCQLWTSHGLGDMGSSVPHVASAPVPSVSRQISPLMPFTATKWSTCCRASVWCELVLIMSSTMRRCLFDEHSRTNRPVVKLAQSVPCAGPYWVACRSWCLVFSSTRYTNRHIDHVWPKR